LVVRSVWSRAGSEWYYTQPTVYHNQPAYIFGTFTSWQVRVELIRSPKSYDRLYRRTFPKWVILRWCSCPNVAKGEPFDCCEGKRSSYRNQNPSHSKFLYSQWYQGLRDFTFSIYRCSDFGQIHKVSSTPVLIMLSKAIVFGQVS
jgi:hypothetical protein